MNSKMAKTYLDQKIFMIVVISAICGIIAVLIMLFLDARNNFSVSFSERKKLKALSSGAPFKEQFFFTNQEIDVFYINQNDVTEITKECKKHGAAGDLFLYFIVRACCSRLNCYINLISAEFPSECFILRSCHFYLKQVLLEKKFKLDQILIKLFEHPNYKEFKDIVNLKPEEVKKFVATCRREYKFLQVLNHKIFELPHGFIDIFDEDK
ncbi:hypothetical protein COBT_003955 [Conglomerata obtusa]